MVGGEPVAYTGIAHLTSERVYAEAAQRLGRKLNAGELAIDIVRADRDLEQGKRRLHREIEREKARVIRGRLMGLATRLRVTDEMEQTFNWLYERGMSHARSEAKRLGVTLPRTYATRPRRIPGYRMALSVDRARGLLGGVQVRVERDVGRVIAEGGTAESVVARALERAIPGALDAASRLVSPAFTDGIADVFAEHADLFKGWAYSAVMDESTCEECDAMDGEEFDSIEALYEVLPDFGPNPECYGDTRCRCRGVPLESSEGAVSSGGDAAGAAAGDLASLLPGAIDVSEADALSGSSNEVYLARGTGARSGDQFIVKPQDDYPPQMRSNITPGKDLEREQGAYVVARHFEEIDPEYAVNTPAYRVGEATGTLEGEGTVRAGIQDFITDAKVGFDSDMRPEDFPSRELRSSALFDIVTGNTDRHAGNWMDKAISGRGPDAELARLAAERVANLEADLQAAQENAALKYVDPKAQLRAEARLWRVEDALDQAKANLESARAIGATHELWLIDHGLAFPERNLGLPVNAHLIEAAAERFGQLDEADLAFVQKLADHWVTLDRDLEAAGIPASARRAMWERITYLLEHGEWNIPGDEAAYG